jgi:hypothetical protein
LRCPEQRYDALVRSVKYRQLCRGDGGRKSIQGGIEPSHVTGHSQLI